PGAELQVVDDQGRLLGAVDVEPRARTAYLDSYLRPLTGNEVDVALVLLGRLLSQAVPGKVREGDVLRRVIAAELVVRAPVGRPKVEPPERREARRHVERQAYEAARRLRSPGAGTARALEVDRTVGELAPLDHNEPVLALAALAGRLRDAQA